MKNIYSMENIFFAISDEMVEIEKVLDQSINSSNVPIIKNIAAHIIKSGGKRLRPALSVLSAKICGGYGAGVKHAAAAVELIHTASLVHDDVLDDADLRRGGISANAKWGNHLSVLVGDFCFSLASQLLSNHTNSETVKIITDAALKTTEGEAIEAINRNNLDITPEAYTDTIRMKTACLFAAACEAGSTLAGAPKILSDALKNFGINLGIAFQIIDDVMDYTSSTNSLGKKTGTDFREGKLTLPLIFALKICDTKEIILIKELLLSSDIRENDFNQVLQILNNHGFLKQATDTAVQYISKAKKSLEVFKPSLEKETLIKCANYVLLRPDQGL